MPPHLLQESLVGREEGEADAFGQGNVGGVVQSDLVSPRDGISFPEEVPRKGVDLHAQVTKQVERGSTIRLFGACAVADGVPNLQKRKLWHNQSAQAGRVTVPDR